MACLVHVALGEWRMMADDLGNMGMLKDRTDRNELAASLAEEVTAVWPLAGSFSSSSFMADGSARQGGELAERISLGSVRPELGLAQGLSFGKLAKVCICDTEAGVVAVAECMILNRSCTTHSVFCGHTDRRFEHQG